MIYDIPGAGQLEIKTIILDLNGTLSVAGTVPDGVKQRLEQLKSKGFKVLFFTGNTRNDADDLATDLGIEWKLAKNAENAEDKRDLALELEPETCASVGNGLIDLELMKAVKLRIVTLQAEGVHIQTMLNSDIVVPTINDALDLFLDEQRLVATLRK
ncbi:HAD family hydrolase [Candidatus Saccharibacteria bacterium]|nr:HAD family hydrolase [Candidatus Saccharibacteria bacterium]MBI3338346.1 HAD family hydrolase [Candidatus Saccharibacteria bacterium]